MTILVLALLFGGQADSISVPLVVPIGFEQAPEAAVVCRDAQGEWERIRWAALVQPAVTERRWRRCRVLLRKRADAFYLATDEITWSTRSTPLEFRSRFRIVRAPSIRGDVTWVSGADDSSASCHQSGDVAECVFVAEREVGAIVARSAEGVEAALVRAGATTAAWQQQRWGRLIRVRTPAGAAADAKVTVLRPALSTASSLLRERAPVSGISVQRVGLHVVWLAARTSAGDAELRLSSAGAAVTTKSIDSLFGPSEVPVDVAMPPERVITGFIASMADRREPATVILSRLLPPERIAGREQTPLEHVSEIEVERDGRFTFDQLAEGEYELLAVHPALGRARQVVKPPADVRLSLTSRRARGRVLVDGVPRAGVVISVLPMLDDLAAASNPLLLASDVATTGADGRFEIVLPQEGHAVLAATTEQAAARVALGDVGKAPEILDVGDVRLSRPREIEVQVVLPSSCRLQAAGPLGSPGLMVVTAVAEVADRFLIRLPVDGRWMFAAVCDERELVLLPPTVEIGRDTRLVELRVRK